MKVYIQVHVSDQRKLIMPSRLCAIFFSIKTPLINKQPQNITLVTDSWRTGAGMGDRRNRNIYEIDCHWKLFSCCTCTSFSHTLIKHRFLTLYSIKFIKHWYFSLHKPKWYFTPSSYVLLIIDSFLVYRKSHELQTGFSKMFTYTFVLQTQLLILP